MSGSRNHVNLAIAHSTTANMDDGQSLPPLIEDGVVWHVVRCSHNKTLWRRVFLQTHANETPPASRDLLGGMTKDQDQ
jgi:hypothetical protein